MPWDWIALTKAAIFGARVQSDLAPNFRVESVISYSLLDTYRSGRGSIGAYEQLELSDERSYERFHVRQDASYDHSEWLFIKGGFEARYGDANYDYFRRRSHLSIEEGTIRLRPNVTYTSADKSGSSFGGYLSPRFRLSKNLVLETGARYDEHGHTNEKALSPRFNLYYELGENIFRASWGIYRQNQELYQLDIIDGSNTFSSSDRIEQRVLSFERYFSGMNLRVEAYQKLTHNPSPFWENVSRGSDPFPEIQFDRFHFVPEHGKAEGVEVSLRKRTSSLDASLSYAYATARDLVGGDWIPRSRDQRHTLGLNLAYTPNEKWQFGMAWHYHTGWPISTMQSRLRISSRKGNHSGWLKGQLALQ